MSVLDSGDDTPARGQTDPGPHHRHRRLHVAGAGARRRGRCREATCSRSGALLYEMLSGAPALPARDRGRDPARGAEGARAAARRPRRGSGPPLGLQPVLDRCLDKEPDDRYADVDGGSDRRPRGRRPRVPARQPRTASTASVRSPPPARALRVLIVDDEDPARALLARVPAARHADVEIVGECRNGFEAVKAVAELEARPRLPRHPDAQARRLRGARADRPRRGRGLRDRLRRARASARSR